MVDQNQRVKEFPDIAHKLQGPSKKSIFEKQKADAEAKKLREKEETAAVYQDFIKSFDDEDEDEFGSANPAQPLKRHFGGGIAGRGSGLSGPGSLGPAPSTRRPPFGTPAGRSTGKPIFAFDDAANTAYQSDDEEKRPEHAAPKLTVHLSSLPPGTSPAVIKSILPLKVDSIRIMPPPGPGTSDRRSTSAIVTLTNETSAIEIDTAVSALQNKYLGWGFYLSISRHLSSAVSGVLPVSASATKSTLPFGARPIHAIAPRGQPVHSHRGGFAPPASYNVNQFTRGGPQVQVSVRPPSDLRQLKLIHKTVENIITHGPEFEALLMSRPDVQRDERWAWIWDAKSIGGVWYRWRLWDIVTGAQRRMRLRNNNIQHQLFANAASWSAADATLPFEYTTALEDIVSDSDYNSSEDEDSGDEGRRRLEHLQGRGPPPDVDPNVAGAEGPAYLNPLRKAKLVYLLSRLPRTNASLRRGDVARITGFAIQHAGSGAEEVVDLITANVHSPFALSNNNSTNEKEEDKSEETNEQKTAERKDSSPMKLIGLYLISDILSSSSTSGVRHAWRYRQLFESSLRSKETFQHLGRIEKDMAWGRLKADKWKRSVMSVLSLWEGWCVFPVKAQEEFMQLFNSPPLTEKEKAAADLVEAERLEKEKSKSKWKTIDDRASQAASKEERQEDPEEEDVDVDVDGEPMDEDNEDLDGEPMKDEDLDGEPLAEDDADVDGEPMRAYEEEAESSVPQSKIDPPSVPEQRPVEKLIGVGANGASSATGASLPMSNAPVARKKRRPRAEDMFADSDGE